MPKTKSTPIASWYCTGIQVIPNKSAGVESNYFWELGLGGVERRRAAIFVANLVKLPDS